MSKKKLDLRETFIDLIIKKSHGCTKDYQSNHAFLEACTIEELQKMTNEDEEDEFPPEISFDKDENEFVLSYE